MDLVNSKTGRIRQRLPQTDFDFFSLEAAAEGNDLSRLPKTISILLEMLLRAAASGKVDMENVSRLASWPITPGTPLEIPYLPARVLLQDFTGVPAVVDLAAMRSAIARQGGDPQLVNPQAPSDLVIDHSVQVDTFGSPSAYQKNLSEEYRRNGERYSLLHWAQSAFTSLKVVPPGRGICHQVNLEYLSKVVQLRRNLAIPDTLVGTDSHTTMVNGLGVLGWGVGGIEAEACLLGQPMYLPTPEVVGVRLYNRLPVGSTATDLVLTLTQLLRQHGVVNKFVEFCGDGMATLSVSDRATLSNMCPEYGATSALWPVDEQTLSYLRMTGRDTAHIELVERYCKTQGLFWQPSDPLPRFNQLLDLDLSAVEPSLAGPRRPQDRVSLPRVWESFSTAFPVNPASPSPTKLDDGSVVIAAITSCTNTSNPSVMVGAGLLAKRAVEAGLRPPPYVKTSLAPGSRVVTDYLQEAKLLTYLEQLGFYLVGYGCTTCIGNSGPLASPEIEAEVSQRGLNVAAVLSGNRNFEARIHPLVKASYLASPPLVVAYGLAGTLNVDLSKDPLGTDQSGNPVFLKDLWPTPEEIAEVIKTSLKREMFIRQYSDIYTGDLLWQEMNGSSNNIYAFSGDSTYIQEPPYFHQSSDPGIKNLIGARCLVWVGDSVTTDHISPAGSIPASSPAGKWLLERQVSPADFNSYGSRRGNHEVMIRGTFANLRLRNRLVEGKEGWWTRHYPSGEEMTIFDASEHYRQEDTPLIVLAGKEYGSGSSRDWAAKGPKLLGVRVVIAESFERIHRSNLIGMGIVPLIFMPGESALNLGLSGQEKFTIRGLGDLTPNQVVKVETKTNGVIKHFHTTAAVINPTEVSYLQHGGVLNTVFQQLISA